MYVCVCNAVTESQIEEAVLKGATSLDEIRKRLHASTCCGACESFVEDCMVRCQAQILPGPEPAPA